MKKTYYLFLGLAMVFPSAVSASEYVVKSPDGKTVVTISDNNGKAVYSVDYDGKCFIQNSPLGLKTNIGDYSDGLSITGKPATGSISESYSIPKIKKSNVEYNANKAELTFSKDNRPAFDLIMQVSDNNIAFRYRLLPVKDRLCCVVEKEITGFSFPEGTTTFLCPQSGPMGGFARTSPSYETNYSLDEPTGKNGWGNGYTFPCLFKNGDNGWTLISETGIAGDYCAAHLSGKTMDHMKLPIRRKVNLTDSARRMLP